MFRFVSSEENLTHELETSITAASAWAHITPTGTAKPVSNAGALVIQSFYDLNNRIVALEHKLDEETRARTEANTRLNEADLVLANHVAQINNLLRDNGMLKRNINQVEHANTLLYQCQVCFERHRAMRLAPCGHMAMCGECTDSVLRTSGLCPLCRIPITKAERTYIS